MYRFANSTAGILIINDNLNAVLGLNFINSKYEVVIPDLEIPRYIRLMDANKMTLDGLITNAFSLEEINEALNLFRSGQAGRIIIKMVN